MRKILALFVFLFIGGALNAQYYDDAPVLSFGLDAAFPASTPASNTHQVGVGGTAKLAIPVGDFSDIVLSGSVMHFSGKTGTQYGKSFKYKARNMLMGLVGYRQYLNPLSDFNTFYLEPRVGLTASGTKNIFLTGGVALGYLINNKIDLSAKYQGMSGFSFIGLGIAYGIGLN